MGNLDIYNKFKTVPQEALKEFNNGKFKGTDINTMWRIKSLTEAFGMCGVGWYFVPKKLWIETTLNNEQFAFAEIELFVKVDGEWSMPISGNGGNKLTRVTKEGEYSTSDEAFKMAVTDALGVACRNLGFGADVYWANDKTKYTEGEKEIAKQGFNSSKSLDEELKTYRWQKGKHTGKLIYETDKDYLEWYIDKGFDEHVKDLCKLAIKKWEEDFQDLQPIDTPEEGLPF